MSETKMADTELQEWLDAKLCVSAHHEAGHAVAAVMVGARVEDLWINDGPDADKWGNCRCAMPARVGTLGFNTFAGPWADARVRWPEGVPLDGVDADVCTFTQRIAQAFAPDDWDEYDPFDLDELDTLYVEPEPGVGDLETYLWVWERDVPAPRASQESAWLGKLECVWPVIQALATHLLDARSMDGDAVHAFVEPMLEGVSERWQPDTAAGL